MQQDLDPLTGLSPSDEAERPFHGYRMGLLQQRANLERAVEANGPTADLMLDLADVLGNLLMFRSAQMHVDEALRLAKVSGIDPMRSFTFYVTELCNLRCQHCFIYDEFSEGYVPRSGELSGADIVDIVRKLAIPGSNRNVFFSGGEVFARRDIETVFRGVADLGFRFAFGTNGTFPERLAGLLADDVVRSRLANVQLSLDGTEAAHERVRGKGTFAPLMESIRIVQSHGVPVNLVTVLQDGNCEDVDNIKALVAQLGPVNHRFQLHAKDRTLRTPDAGRFKDLIDIREFHMATKSPTVPGSGCTSGIRTCSIRSNGVVEACRMSVVGNVAHLVLGNLCDYDLDMNLLLASDEARETRGRIPSCIGCALYCGR